MPPDTVGFMNDAEVLYLHGSPGSGKTTLSQELAELLNAAGKASAAIDMDELSLVFPHSDRHAFARSNLAAIWPNYAAIPGVKVIINGVVADEEERGLLRNAVAGAPFTVCELTAPKHVLKARVTAREPDEDSQKGLRDWVDIYHRRTDLAKVRDFAVSTHNRSVEEAAREVLAKTGW
jgi:predicted kinase